MISDSSDADIEVDASATCDSDSAPHVAEASCTEVLHTVDTGNLPDIQSLPFDELEEVEPEIHIQVCNSVLVAYSVIGPLVLTN